MGKVQWSLCKKTKKQNVINKCGSASVWASETCLQVLLVNCRRLSLEAVNAALLSSAGGKSDK